MPVNIADLFDVYKIRLEVKDGNMIFGGLPADPEVLKKWMDSKQIPKDIVDEEKADLELAVEESYGQKVFRRSDTGLFLRDFMFKACIKASSQQLGYTKKLKGLKGRFELGTIVKPRNVYLCDLATGKPMTEATGTDEIQGKVYTPAGFKSILTESEYVTDCYMELEWHMIPFRGYSSDKLELTWQLAQTVGLGARRSREEGQFEVVSFEKIKSATKEKKEDE